MMTTNAVLRTGQSKLPPIRGLPDAFELHPFDCNQDGTQRKKREKRSYASKVRTSLAEATTFQ